MKAIEALKQKYRAVKAKEEAAIRESEAAALAAILAADTKSGNAALATAAQHERDDLLYAEAWLAGHGTSIGWLKRRVAAPWLKKDDACSYLDDGYELVSPLAIACYEGNESMWQWLVSRGCGHPDSNMLVPMRLAAQQGTCLWVISCILLSSVSEPFFSSGLASRQ